MGNAHTHDRRKSGAPETGLTIEGIREKPLNQHERKHGRVEKKVGNDRPPDKGSGSSTGTALPINAKQANVSLNNIFIIVQ